MDGHLKKLFQKNFTAWVSRVQTPVSKIFYHMQTSGSCMWEYPSVRHKGVQNVFAELKGKFHITCPLSSQSLSLYILWKSTVGKILSEKHLKCYIRQQRPNFLIVFLLLLSMHTVTICKGTHESSGNEAYRCKLSMQTYHEILNWQKSFWDAYRKMWCLHF